jgi:sugar phosphate isomerase/epimerase
VRAGPADRLCLLSSAVHHQPAEAIAERAAAAGFARIEWGAGPGQAAAPDPAAGARLRALSEARGLHVEGVCMQGGSAPLGDLEAVRAAFAFGAALGAPFVRLWPPSWPEGTPFADALARGRERVAEAAALARAEGVMLLLENANDTLGPSTGLVRALLADCDPAEAGALWDPANGVIEGAVDVRIEVAELGPYLHHVHVKNIAWRHGDDGWTWGHAPLREGLIDWPRALAALTAAGYEGALTLDHLAHALEDDAAELRALLAETA